MLSEEIIIQLLKIKSETGNLDYKASLNWENCSRDEKLKLVKDILAMSNTQDGGRILFGVRNSDYEFVGMTEEDFNSFDQTKVNDLLCNFTDPKFTCQVYKHKLKEKDDKFIVAIDVPEFPEVLTICKNDAHSSDDNAKQILRRGQIYIRTDKGTSEAISSVDEMRALLGRALTKKGDELLNSIQRLIIGKPLAVSRESEQSFSDEIAESERFFSDVLSEELKKFGYWEVCAYPTSYNPQRVLEHKKIRELIEKTQVRQRGWYFPHIDHSGKNNSNFNSGWQSSTVEDEKIQHRAIEAFRAYQSGLFVFKKALWDDTLGRQINGRQMLSISDAIWSITEFFLFFKRFYEEIIPEEDLHVKLSLSGAKNRELIFHGLIAKIFEHISNEETIRIIDRDIKVIDLRASYKSIASEACKKLLAVFNWNDVTDGYIDEWQTKLIEKQF